MVACVVDHDGCGYVLPGLLAVLPLSTFTLALIVYRPQHSYAPSQYSYDPPPPELYLPPPQHPPLPQSSSLLPTHRHSPADPHMLHWLFNPNHRNR
jgi:hypothetical protein